ncbi:MAG TPA: hypothetical protein VN874_02075 [Myxococcales bacterium]|jgi:hypothetical protein|nr:hypothetical protein [Myxococcales bacterium]
MNESEAACLARLTEMDRALELMQAELPDDALPIGDEARAKVRVWLTRLAEGGADLGALSLALAEIGSLMDELTARLLLVPWGGFPKPPSRPS